MKVSSVDENYQSTDINALSLNRFHASEGTRRKYDGQIRQLPSDSIDSGDSIAGFTKILDQSLWIGKCGAPTAMNAPARRRFATQPATPADAIVGYEGFAGMTPTARTFPDPEGALAGAQFADRYVLITDGLALTAIGAAERVLGRTPGWVGLLTQLRNLAVRPFGLKTGADPDAPPESRIGIFPLISQAHGRVVLGLDDRHLDFRILVEVNDLGAGRQEVAASTIVKTHNLLGRTYLAIIMPFHRIIVPAMLAQVLIK